MCEDGEDEAEIMKNEKIREEIKRKLRRVQVRKSTRTRAKMASARNPRVRHEVA
jgi:hypothetical protein